MQGVVDSAGGCPWTGHLGLKRSGALCYFQQQAGLGNHAHAPRIRDDGGGSSGPQRLGEPLGILARARANHQTCFSEIFALLN